MKNKNYDFAYYLAFVTPIFFTISCDSKHKILSKVVNVSNEAKNLMNWDTTYLFKNEIFRDIQKTEIETPNATTSIEIRAFQHKFFDDTTLLKPTWVVGYVKAGTKEGEESLPGPILEARYGNTTHVRFLNKLEKTMIYNAQYPFFKYKSDSCRWFPIIYNVSDSNHQAMTRQMLYPKPEYTGEIPICRGTTMPNDIPEASSYYSTTVHLHGANVSWHSDGYVNSKYLTKAPNVRQDIPFGLFGPYERNKGGVLFSYPNKFPEGNYNNSGSLDTTKGKHGAILWYHDHSMMRTSLNVYAGMAGAYIIEGQDEYKTMRNVYQNRDSENDTDYGFFSNIWRWITQRFGYKKDDNDIPLLITDKSFTKNGFLYYNTTASKTQADSTVTPEFLGDVIVVNGKIWPFMKVNRDVYRLRLLNGSSTRFYRFALTTQQALKEQRVDSAAFVQIGTEGGLMPNFVNITHDAPLTLGPGERADVLVDFSQFKQSDIPVIINYAANGPYQADENVALTKFGLTNYVMQFRFDTGTSTRNLDDELIALEKSREYLNITSNLKSYSKQPRVSNQPFKVKLEDSMLDKVFIMNLDQAENSAALPSTFRLYAMANGLKLTYPMILMQEESWDSEATLQNKLKTVYDGEEQTWVIINNTDDVHPIHLHLNRFTILGHRPNNSNDSLTLMPDEQGWKDVVQARPMQTTYIRVKYLLSDADRRANREGQFVYHCHILEHEDVSMMRRLIVKPKI